MQIFELHFNSKNKEERVFDSFVYEPENIYEKKLGSLYLVGELKNPLPQNSKFLDTLAGVIKGKYYTLSFRSPEKALSEGLRKVNEFLSEEIKRENVSWLGNLNFAVLSLKDFNLTFTKTGELKILLARGGQLTDIGKDLDLQEIEPYPLKVFFNIVSGKLVEDDVILILTKEVFDFFSQENILTKIAQGGIDENKIKEILPPQLLNKGEITGICFLAVLKRELKPVGELLPNFQRIAPQEKIKKISYQKEKKFSLKEFIPNFRLKSSLRDFFQKIWNGLIRKIKRPFPRSQKLTNLIKKTWIIKKIPSFKIKLPALPSSQAPQIRKKLILILLLAFILIVGFLIFQTIGKEEEKEIWVPLNNIQAKVSQAENFLIFKNEEQAKILFQEAWQEISLLEEDSSSQPEIASLKEEIEKHLEDLEGDLETKKPEKEAE